MHFVQLVPLLLIFYSYQIEASKKRFVSIDINTYRSEYEKNHTIFYKEIYQVLLAECADVCNLPTNTVVKCLMKPAGVTCECVDADYKFDYEEKVCKLCTCGENMRSCEIEEGKIKCLCQDGFSLRHGKCEECDCGVRGNCSFIYGEKSCECENGFSESNGTCKECECGVYGSCAFVDGEKTCKCENGFSEINGTCEECECGVYGNCSFINGEKICVCEKGFGEKYGSCEECDCGKNGICSFIDGNKTCECKRGYYVKNGTCVGACEMDYDCYNGARCVEGECKCLPKTTGSRCQDIDCRSLDPRCRLSGGNCSYNVSRRDIFCECQYPKTYNNYTRRCEATCALDRDCFNGAWCLEAECKCLPKTTGPRCEVLDCSSLDPRCKPSGGRCSYDASRRDIFCECRKSQTYNNHTGRCEDSSNPCVSKPCQNGGTCIKVGNGFSCFCRAAFSGDLCENDSRKMKIALWVLSFAVAVLLVIIGIFLFKRSERK